MIAVLLIIHLFVTLSLIGVVLIQRSEGGGLGIGSSQGMGSFMSGRGTANLLTRTTAILATLFMALSLTLALLNRGTGGPGRSILAEPPPGLPAPVVPTGGAPGGTGAGTGAAGTVPFGPQGSAPSGVTPGALPSTGAAPAQGPSVPTN